MLLPFLLATFWWSPVWAQQGGSQLPLADNKGDLVGTWVSGSQSVVTGPNFANPMKFSFTYPKTTGVSYSFSSDGFFEEAWYKFTPNGTAPNCITGVLQWQHGTYEALANNSIIMTPFSSDGRQQVQDTCAAVSNIIQQFNSTVLMKNWRIDTDPVLGKMLLLFQFDGTPVQPLYPYASPPVMLPTQVLTANVTAGQMGGAMVPQGILSLTLVGLIGGLIGIAAIFFQ